jgi:tetratricopeptide (TPR) repeat protein
MPSVRRFVVLVAVAVACTRALPPGAVKTVVERSTKGKRVIFVGLDGADWRLLDRFTADGTMPELAKIEGRAERRVLVTQHPPLSPLVWTSMMTGVSPLEHRILDFTRFNPKTRAQEPITSDERAVPAIWNMARYGGKRAAVFGLWATYPPEPGVVLTDRDLPRDYTAATELVARRALDVIREEKPDLAIVYIQGTDEIGHLTSGNIDAARAYFHRVDQLLGEFRKLAEANGAELVIASDHGFDWGGSHAESATATATAAKWHAEEGVWLAWPRERATRGQPMHVVDVCAALRTLLGLPNDLDYRRYFVRQTAAAATQASGEQIAKLKSLGYLASTAPAPRNATSTRTPQSFNNEGLILRELHRDDDAQRAFEAALRLDPSYASPRQNLDDLLAARGIARLRTRDCSGALADFRGVHRESALLFASIAAAEGCLGHEAAAEQAVRRSLALNPDQPELRALLRP